MSVPCRFLRFKSGAANTIWRADRRAFLLDTPDGAPAIVDGTCPHRGGPLALGQYDCKTATLRCPWHGRRHKRRQLLARAWPSLRIGEDWVVAIPVTPDESDSAQAAIYFRRDQLAVEPGP